MDQSHQCNALLPQIQEIVNALGGKVILEQGFRSEGLEESASTSSLMLRVKRELDPTGTFWSS